MLLYRVNVKQHFSLVAQTDNHREMGVEELKVTHLDLEGVLLLKPEVFEDFRGYYSESYSARTLKKIGIDVIFVQDNHLLSKERGIIRGIHFQNNPKAQTKLLRCTKGAILDVVVDLRKGSPTYKQWLTVEMTAQSKLQILIPRGFGHACMSLEQDTEVQYKVDEFYEPLYDRAIAWNDPDLNINWGTDKVILSDKDMRAPFLQDSDINFIYNV